MKRWHEQVRSWASARAPTSRGFSWVHAGTIFAVAVVARLAYWAYAGTRFGKDTAGYLDVCGLWVSAPLEAARGAIGIEYAGFTVPLCSVVGLTGSYDAWIVFQILLSSLAAVLVYDTVRRALGPPSALVGGLAMALLWEMFQWDVYVLSDTSFVFVVSLTLWSITRFHLSPSRGNRVLAMGSLGLLAVTRPVGAPMVMAYVVADLWQSRGTDGEPGLLPRWGAVLALVALIAIPALVSARSTWADAQLLEAWSQGRIVHDDASFDYPFRLQEASTPLGFVLANPLAMVAMAILKVGAFFVPFVFRYSTVHIVVNVVTLLPMMVAGAAGVHALVQREKVLAMYWLIPLVVTLLIVAGTFVDWDWRYRAPTGPTFALLSAGFLDALLRRG